MDFNAINESVMKEEKARNFAGDLGYATETLIEAINELERFLEPMLLDDSVVPSSPRDSNAPSAKIGGMAQSRVASFIERTTEATWMNVHKIRSIRERIDTGIIPS